MKKTFLFILALIAEIILLAMILALLVLAMVGALLPVLPGLFFVALVAGIYSLMIRYNLIKITGWAHPRFNRFKEKILKLKITQKIMGLIKDFKKQKKDKAEQEIIKKGFILFGFNLVLVGIFLFGLTIMAFLAVLFESALLAAVLPLAMVFIFAASSAVVWYRFGQILGKQFKKNKILNSALVVLVSLLPLLIFLLIISVVLGGCTGEPPQILMAVFMGVILMAVLAAAFELLAVSLGAITVKK